jgi:2-keto-3-deoxy-L-rhamnonate aldolase RhmA
MEKIGRIIAKIERKEPVIGTYVSLQDPAVSEMIGFAGYDFAWVDMEHTGIGKRELQNHIVAADSANIATFVRIPWNDPVLVKPLLEMGPDGIIFPLIRTADDARLAVASCTYPPKGIRGFGPIRAIRYGLDDSSQYIERGSKNFWKVLQIEHVDAVDHIDEILAVEGIDSLMFGPNDLSGSLGLLGQTSHPQVLATIERAAKAIVAANIPFGAAIGFSETRIKYFLSIGASWLIIGGDFGLLASGFRNQYLETLRLMEK